jgi:hypothetical protein
MWMASGEASNEFEPFVSCGWDATLNHIFGALTSTATIRALPAALPVPDGPRAVLHIGTHKTGTTSFQAWAAEAREALRARGVRYFKGMYGKNHFDLAFLALRRNRNMPMRSKHPDWCLDEWQAEARAHLQEQSSGAERTLLCSAEALSYVRFADEVETLVELFAPRQVQVVVAFREPDVFLQSYKEDLAVQGFRPSRYPESFAYVKPDTWLLRYDDLLDAYRSVLGEEHVASIRYEEAVERDGSIIPALLDAAAIDRTGLPEVAGHWENARADRGKDESAGLGERLGKLVPKGVVARTKRIGGRR